MNYESIIKEQIEVLKERQKVADHEDAMKISSEIRCWMQKAMDLGIETITANENADESINTQIMERLATLFDEIKNHEDLDELSLRSFSNIEDTLKGILNSLNTSYVLTSSKGA